ncbi:Flavin-containing monooxygenase [Rhynchospora pubera]|uniref:Flavin-containing monooxygenase n=1 Tax=Rhynchospora pubera TaxID=906938 RepID=A0AAV8DJ71_9POAL|nr:Flavin-containing monooxygenase [Rhynchospora pubera]
MSFIEGPIIIGAGPSGLAIAASLTGLSVPYIILERSTGIADLWRNHTYDRLSLHLPKQFCELPHLPFPPNFPIYPSKSQFLQYLETYTSHFSITPQFSKNVIEARFDSSSSVWRVKAKNSNGGVVVYVSKWIVVATGENAEPVIPIVKGRERFKGDVLHSGEYRNGDRYKGKKVLVIGCGNSGMEICLDLFDHGALPLLDMFGVSTFDLAVKLLKGLPVKLVDQFLVLASKMILGDAEKYGLRRPKVGPLEIKNITGKSPVLDVGALSLIKSGKIKVVPEVETFTTNGGRFIDGNEITFDSILFATGYRSNVPLWLKNCDFFTGDGKPKNAFPYGWKGENGLYTVGFTGKGLYGASSDALKVAQDIAQIWSKTPNK